jgi:hypothetical protein
LTKSFERLSSCTSAGEFLQELIGNAPEDLRQFFLLPVF